MTSFDLISMAVRNLWKRKLRTFLTILGVIIGTASIVVMVSLGIGMNESFEARLSQRGNLRVITVNSSGGGSSRSYRGGMMISSSSNKKPGNKDISLDEKAVNSFKKISGVEAVSPMVRGWFRVKVDRYVGDLTVIGIDPSNMEAFGYKLAEGRLLTEGDELAMVVGAQATRYNFTDPKLSGRARWQKQPESIDLMAQKKVEITYDSNYGEKPSSSNSTEKKQKPAKAYKLNIVGTLDETDQNSYSTFMPISQVQKLLKEQAKFQKEQSKEYGYGTSSSGTTEKQEYDTVMVKCYNMEEVQAIQDIIKEMGFEAHSLTDELEAQKETSKSMQALLGAIGAVSLLVAAIGITNTMVMSIYERTKEIGVMKVIGASIKDIKRLFLVEAALIGFLGGIFGVALSLGISKILNSAGVSFMGMADYGVGGMGEKISSIPVWLCLVSLFFSACVGIVSGYFPARRAMNLSAISAIHSE